MTTVSAAAERLDRFVELKARKAELERDLRVVKDELAPLEAELLEDFAAEGVAGKRHAASGKLVSISRRVWARAAGEKDAAADALVAAGLGDYVQRGFNTNSLSALFRERLKEKTEAGEHVRLEDLLEPELRGFINLTTDETLSVRS